MGTPNEITVLLVDDAPDFAELAQLSLQRADELLDVQTATSASEGLELLATESVDCIVSDYEMPERNGIAFLETVREDHPSLPFILFTGKGSEAIASDAISAGVTDYLQKETGTEQYTLLANRIRNAVDRYRGQQERTRQREAIETAHEGISILNADGEFIYVNQAYADLYGYTPTEMLGEHWQLIYPDDEVSFATEVILPTATEMGYWQGETTGLRADGTTFPEAHTVVITETGELVCTVRDRSQTDERASGLHRFQTLVKALNDPVYMLDGTGRFQYVNDAFVDLVEYDRERILGATPSLIKSEAAVEQGNRELGALLSADGPDTTVFEIEVQPKTSDPVYCEDHMGVLPYEGAEFGVAVC